MSSFLYSVAYIIVAGPQLWGQYMEEKLLRAAGHEKRIQIIGALRDGPLGYADLMRKAGFGMSESGRFAYHLKRLEEAGLVSKGVDG